MDSYNREKVEHKAAKDELMRFEWARYESFKDFPENSPMMPTRLARCGFYYTGNDEEVVCFCCGVRIRHWCEGQTADEVHRHLSPGCNFIRGDASNNVAIYADERRDTVSKRNEHCVSRSSDNDFAESNATYPSGKPEKSDKYVDVSTTNAATEISESTLSNDNTMVNYRDSKHPEYVVMSDRMSSFKKWPSYHVQKPYQMAEAGFYYAGFGDCVRCFYCGGGLRNWEYGDTPWEEHARWYPRCGYLIHCKGEEFVRRYQQPVIDSEDDEEALYNHIDATFAFKKKKPRDICDHSPNRNHQLKLGHVMSLSQNVPPLLSLKTLL